MGAFFCADFFTPSQRSSRALRLITTHFSPAAAGEGRAARLAAAAAGLVLARLLARMAFAANLDRTGLRFTTRGLATICLAAAFAMGSPGRVGGRGLGEPS